MSARLTGENNPAITERINGLIRDIERYARSYADRSEQDTPPANAIEAATVIFSAFEALDEVVSAITAWKVERDAIEGPNPPSAIFRPATRALWELADRPPLALLLALPGLPQ